MAGQALGHRLLDGGETRVELGHGRRDLEQCFRLPGRIDTAAGIEDGQLRRQTGEQLALAADRRLDAALDLGEALVDQKHRLALVVGKRADQLLDVTNSIRRRLRLPGRLAEPRPDGRLQTTETFRERGDFRRRILGAGGQ